ncbi:MAG: phosphatase PAP2 family protein [Candidatus Delongbacteria bacterium]|jgi:undecaprenyl-diphosphatase|nr:phosphatase PAP2 family protein [Candidatus Delongbacteria bacterium]
MDKEILFFFNQTIHSELLNPVFIFFSSRVAALLFLIFPLALLVKGYREKDKNLVKKIYIMLIATGITIALADIISSRIFKPLFQRPRPCQTISDLWFWKKKKDIWILSDGIKSLKGSYSFVSSHASNSMGVAVLWSIFYKRWAWLFLSIAILVGVSRMYLGVHYPSDIIGGFALGSFIAIFCKYLVEILKKKYIKG